MAEISTWLRGFQTPRPSESPTSIDSTYTTKETGRRRRRSSRGGSFNLSSGRANGSSFQEPICNARDLDRVWHNPNTDQLAESLKVVMMRQGCCEPVPVHYNACILNVLEAYHDTSVELRLKTRQLEDAEAKAARTAKDLQDRTLQWKIKEDNYKMELKNMEIMLAGGERRLEPMTLARSDSAIHRGKRPVPADYGRNGQIDDNADSGVVSEQKKDIMIVDFAAQQDRQLSRRVLLREAIDVVTRQGIDRLDATDQPHYFEPRIVEETEQTQQDPPSSQGDQAGKYARLGISDCHVPVQLSDIQVPEIPKTDSPILSIFQWKRKTPATKAGKLRPTDAVTKSKKKHDVLSSTVIDEKVTEPKFYAASTTVNSDMTMAQIADLTSALDLDIEAPKVESSCQSGGIHAKDAVLDVSISGDPSRISRPLQRRQRATTRPRRSDRLQSSEDGILSEQNQNASLRFHTSNRTGDGPSSSSRSVWAPSTWSITNPGGSEKSFSKIHKHNGRATETALAAARIAARREGRALSDGITRM